MGTMLSKRNFPELQHSKSAFFPNLSFRDSRGTFWKLPRLRLYILSSASAGNSAIVRVGTGVYRSSLLQRKRAT